jgi:TonB family protein
MAFHLHAVERQVSAMYATPKRSALLSGLLHAAAIVAALSVASVRNPSVIWKPVALVGRDIGRYLASVPREAVGGGGGGTRSDTRASAGRLPRAAPRQFTPPVVEYVNLNPQLPMEPTLVMSEIALPNIDLPRFGDPNGVSGPASGGRGSGGGIGDGIGTGVGDSPGPGYGPGPGGGGGVPPGPGSGGLEGGITQPVLLWKIEPEYTDEARRAKVQGTVILHIEVDTRGQAQNITVRQSLGLGLDERAIEAVRRWRFRPGYRDGKPWVTAAMVQVNFRLM